MNFAPGDRVVCTRLLYVGISTRKIEPGSPGTVLWADSTAVSVEFDENIGGHDGSVPFYPQAGRKGHCAFVSSKDLCLYDVPEESADITNFDSVL